MASHDRPDDGCGSCALAALCFEDGVCIFSFGGETLNPRLKVGVPTSMVMRLVPKLKERLSVLVVRLCIADGSRVYLARLVARCLAHVVCY